MKRLRLLGLLLVLAIIFSLLPTGALAADTPPPPPTPHRFYGMIALRNLDGSVSVAAPSGMESSAWIGGVQKGTANTTALLWNDVLKKWENYGNGIGGILQIVGNSGDIVTFRVNGVVTGQTYPWASGGFTSLDLTVTDSVIPTVTLNDIPPTLASLTEVSGTAVDILGIAKVQVAVNNLTSGKSWDSAGNSWVTGTDILWFDAIGTASWTSAVPSLAGGQSYTVSARAIDLVGNISSTVSDTFFIEDIVPPATPLLLSPADNLYTTFTTHTFLWTAVTDPAGVSYDLQVDNNADFSSPEVNLAGMVDTAYASSALLDGNYSWRVRAIDGALNASPWTAVRSLHIDTGVPSVVITPPTDPTNDNTPTLGGTAIDLISPIASVEYRVDGGSWIAAAASDSVFNSTTEGYTFTTAALADGAHQVEVRATDILGFSTAAENYAGDTFKVDTIAPSISGIKSGGITATGAIISWNTNEPATSQIEYGPASTTHGNYSSGASVPGLSAVHSVALSGLVLGSTYYYRVISLDEAGNQTVSAEFSFSTQSDLTPPVISDVTAAGLTPSSAIIMWNTDEESTSQVEYGKTSTVHGSYSFSSPLNSSLVIGHGASLSGLTANTTYYYRVISRDAIGNETVSGEFNFQTSPDSTLPVISGVLVTNITTTSAIIKWLTNEPANSRVEYGLTTDYGSTIALDPALVFVHSKSISGLALSSTYHYRIRSADAAGNVAVSADMTFATLADSTPPLIFNIAEIDITTSEAWITWITNEGATAQVAYGISQASGSYGNAAAVLAAYPSASAMDTTLALGHGLGLSGLTPNTPYFYRVISIDDFGNASWSDEDSFTTLADNIPPVISDIIESDITTSDAWVLWFTDEPANSQVAYGATSHAADTYSSAAGVLAAYTSFSAKDTTLSIFHGTGLSDLTPNTAYFYRVISIDDFGNESISAEESFTTLPDTNAPAISDIIETGITQTGAILYWNTDELATSRVEYGVTSAAHGSYVKMTSLDTTLVYIHGVVISGLTPNTTYYFRVISQDASGNEAWSAEDSFTTLADETPPTITGITVTNITDTMAIIYWNTNEKATTRVEYGKTISYDKLTPLNTALIFNHGVVISGLTPNTEYHFKVKSSDAYGNEGVSVEDLTFTTKPDATEPTFANVTATSVTGSSAVISWTTNEKSTTRVEYGESIAYGSLSLLNTNLVLNHSVLLVGLTPDTEYHYSVLSSDAAGNAGQSGDLTFNTVPDDTPPVISGIIEVNVTDTSAVILWLTDEPSGSQVVYSTISHVADIYVSAAEARTAYGLWSTEDITPVTNHGVALDGLTVGNTYFYRVISKDADGNEAVSDEGLFTTADATAPDITSVLSVAITSSGAVIVWITDENATTQVVYGVTSHAGDTYADAVAASAAYGASTIEDGTLIPSHGVVLSGLTSATTYYYRVISEDAAHNVTISAEFSFTTT